MQRFNYRTPPIKYVMHNTLDARRAAFNIYLRLPPVPHPTSSNTLVIARISFQKTRAGHGSSLLAFLAEQSKKYVYEHIVIEQTNENSSSFAKKMGFKKVNEENWIIDTVKLKTKDGF